MYFKNQKIDDRKLLKKKEVGTMHTLFDFLTYVKGIEYIIALSSIAGFILLWEILKPKPFNTLVHSGKEDLEYVRKTGYRNILKTMGKVAAAPFIGLFYVIVLPFAFFFAVAYTAINSVLALAGRSVSFGWRPAEAYLAGKKKRRRRRKKEEGETKKNEKK